MRIIYLLFIVLSSCHWAHDIGGKYNGYFLANEKIKTIVDSISIENKDNYTEILDIFPSIDTTYAEKYKSSFDYCIQKASSTIQWFKRSKWVDDCYLIVGKVRFFQGDFINSINTFYYLVNNTSHLGLRNQALIYLLWNFIENNDKERFEFAKNYLEKISSSFEEKNFLLYYLVMAHHYKINENFAMAGVYAKLALPYLKTKKEKARIHFFIGQIYEFYKKFQEATKYYMLAKKYSHNYEIRLYADMKYKNMLHVDRPGSLSAIHQFYTSLLKEEKNWDLRDRIHYEYGNYLLLQNKIEEASQEFNNSIQLHNGPKHLKGKSYLMKGDLFLTKKEYLLASSYYDSAFTLLKKKIFNYKNILSQKEKLSKFKSNYLRVEQIDKLLYLKTLSQKEQMAFFKKEIKKEKEAIIKRNENQKLNELNRIKKTEEEFFSNATSQWYFHDENKKRAGSVEFAKLWGARKLQDHWRQSSKLYFIQQKQNNNNFKNGNQVNKKSNNETHLFNAVKSIEERLQEIPSNKQDIMQLNTELATKLYELGKNYIFDLEDIDRGMETLENFAQRYPHHQNTAEAYYTLIMICNKFSVCQKEEQDRYRKILLEKYTDSFYANIIKNPNFIEETNQMDREIEELYTLAFQEYQKNNYEKARNFLQKIENSYPKNNMEEKTQLLSILVNYYLSGDKKTTKQKIKKFIIKYENSKLRQFATHILNNIQ